MPVLHRIRRRTEGVPARSSGGIAPIGAAKYRRSYGLDGTAEQADQSPHLLLERQRDAGSANPRYDRAATPAALDYRGLFDNGLCLHAGARFDKNSVFADATAWAPGLSYTLLQSGTRLHTSAGTGVVNLSYFELYANDFGYAGNPNLRPEENHSVDLGG